MTRKGSGVRIPHGPPERSGQSARLEPLFKVPPDEPARVVAAGCRHIDTATLWSVVARGDRLRAGEAGLSGDGEDPAVGCPHRGVLHGEPVAGQRRAA
jgi:hypothetical protein